MSPTDSVENPQAHTEVQNAGKIWLSPQKDPFMLNSGEREIVAKKVPQETFFWPLMCI